MNLNSGVEDWGNYQVDGLGRGGLYLGGIDICALGSSGFKG